MTERNLENKNTVLIHPTVILSISDYFNRMHIISGGKVKRVFGALMGTQSNNKFEILYSFEFFNQDDVAIDLDRTFIDDRKKLSEQLFPNYDLLGFYSTTDNNDDKPEDDQSILNIMESYGVLNPINLVLRTADIFNAEELPISVYEYKRQTQAFSKINLELEAFDSERITLETVTKSKDASTKESVLNQSKDTVKNAVNVLKGNLALILNEIEGMEKKGVKIDEGMLLRLNDLVINLPRLSSSKESLEILDKFYKEVLVLGNLCCASSTSNYLGRLNLNK